MSLGEQTEVVSRCDTPAMRLPPTPPARPGARKKPAGALSACNARGPSSPSPPRGRNGGLPGSCWRPLEGAVCIASEPLFFFCFLFFLNLLRSFESSWQLSLFSREECALGKVEGLSVRVGVFVFVLRAVSRVGYIGLVFLGLFRRAHNEVLIRRFSGLSRDIA